MKVVDPGHRYELACLDTGTPAVQVLTFVNRVGDKFPGNKPPAYHGTTTQEVLRALIDRTKYVDRQDPHRMNGVVIGCLRHCLEALERRAAERRGERLRETWLAIEDEPTCATCGHVECGVHR